MMAVGAKTPRKSYCPAIDVTLHKGVGTGVCVSIHQIWVDLVMIQPQVHLRLPCYDFYFL